MKKFLLLIVLLTLCLGCATNPGVTKLKQYEMRIALGRDRAFVKALELTKQERINVEEKYIYQQMENDQLIAVYEILSEIPQEEAEKKVVMSIDDVKKISLEKEKLFSERKIEINKAYENFYLEIKKQDEKISSIRESVKELEEMRDETYSEITKMFAVALASIGITLAY